MRITRHGFAVLDEDKDLLLSKWCDDDGRLDQDRAIETHYVPQIPLGGVVVDVGAAIGDHTIAYLRKAGPGGTVYAFEPNPLMFECLSFNCKEARLYPLGLGDRPAVLPLQHDSRNAGGSYVGRHIQWPLDVFEVSVIPLDLLQLDSLHFMKLDIEGLELKALMGAEKTLLKCKPTIVLERSRDMLSQYGDTADSLDEFLASLGYHTSAFMGNVSDERCELIARPRP